jgi:hypothetical protein
MAEIERLGPLLHLDEPSPSHEWVRFDAPGDFQLCLRDDFVAVDGFDERMLLGWHVDSNFSRRMLLYRGSIESLEGSLAGYHCNHNRTPTVYHGPQPVGNDPGRFFLTVERAPLPEQRDTWGLADAVLREVPLASGVSVRLTDALLDAVRPAARGQSTWNPFEQALALTYDSAHVLPHLADSIAVSGSRMTIGYLGANPVLREMIDHVVRELSEDGSLTALYASNVSDLDALAESADLLIVDFGLDATVAHESMAGGDGSDVRIPPFPEELRPVAIAFERLIQRERARLEQGLHARRFLLVNSTTVYLDSFVVANLDCSSRATHSRVRRASVKVVPTSNVRLLRDIQWADRLEEALDPLELRIGRTTRFGDLEDFGGFGPGWWLPDTGGIWTQGSRAVLRVTCGEVPTWSRPLLDLTFDRVGVRRGRSVQIGLVVDGTRIDTRSSIGAARELRWRVLIPRHALARRVFDIALEFDGQVDWADDNRLGLHLQSLGVRTGLIPPALRSWLERGGEVVASFVRFGRRAASPWKRRLTPARVLRGGASRP